jgi:hypothetical protein
MHTNSAVGSMSSWLPLELSALYITSVALKASESTTTAFEDAANQNDLQKPFYLYIKIENNIVTSAMYIQTRHVSFF